MQQRNAIVVVVDRLSAAFLGPYGNTWLDTPEFNRMAADATLFDFALSDSADLGQVYRSYWRGLHSLSTDWGDTPNVIEALQRHGVYTQLVTDEPRVAELELASAFAERQVLEPPRDGSACDDIAQTQLARLFAAATEAAESLSPPFLLWVHARGMEGLWDAPYALRGQLAEEGDPDPPDLVQPPHLELAPGYDPDELLGYVRAYAGQVAALDVCCGALHDALNRCESRDSTLRMWTSPRGYPLGEHLLIGDGPGELFSETLQVPMLLQTPSGRLAGARTPAFMQPPDIAATLLDWWQLPWITLRYAQNLSAVAEIPESPTRLAAVAAAGERLSVRTAAWFAATAAGRPLQLFVKPDDRFEANEVSSRCLPAAEAMQTWIEMYRDAAATGFASFPLLPNLLRYGLEGG